jgi:hypothetical protein
LRTYALLSARRWGHAVCAGRLGRRYPSRAKDSTTEPSVYCPKDSFWAKCENLSFGQGAYPKDRWWGEAK